MNSLKNLILIALSILFTSQHSPAMLNSLPMELTQIIFCDVVTSDTPADLKKEYHIRKCEKARNLLTLCKKFYNSQRLHEMIIASIIDTYSVREGRLAGKIRTFSPIYTCAYLSTPQAKQWLFQWLLKDSKNREHAIKLWVRQYQEGTLFHTGEFAKQKHMLRTLMAAGISVDQDSYKQTLLMKACKHGDTKMEEFLMAHCANKDIVDAQGHNAQYYKNMRILHEFGACITPISEYYRGPTLN